MKNSEKALETFREGFVCSQSVLRTYSEQFGVDPTIALKLATGFGGGIAKTAQICGAVTGGLMVLGLAFGQDSLENSASKEKTYDLSRQLMASVNTQFGSCICKEILGVDISTAEGFQQAKERGLFSTTCCDCIEHITKTLDEMLAEA